MDENVHWSPNPKHESINLLPFHNNTAINPWNLLMCHFFCLHSLHLNNLNFNESSRRSKIVKLRTGFGNLPSCIIMVMKIPWIVPVNLLSTLPQGTLSNQFDMLKDLHEGVELSLRTIIIKRLVGICYLKKKKTKHKSAHYYLSLHFWFIKSWRYSKCQANQNCIIPLSSLWCSPKNVD